MFYIKTKADVYLAMFHRIMARNDKILQKDLRLQLSIKMR